MTSTRVLAVDDERANLHLLATALRNEGLLVDLATSGEQALETARSTPPDLVLLDIGLPGLDGFQVLERFRQLEGCRTTPVIFLTSLEEVSAKLHGFSLGAVDYVVKPFHLEELRARVRIHLQLSLSLKALAQGQAKRLESLVAAQRSILTRPEEHPEARFSVHFQPVQEAGGDLYDVVEIGPGVHGYFVGDVSGHDLGTSLVASAATALLRQNSGPAWSPEDTLRMINGALVDWLPSGRFLTGCLARLNRNTHSLRLVGAGHPPPALLQARGGVSLLDCPGDVLGAFREAQFGLVERKVQPGDVVVTYTDGLLEKPGRSLEESLQTLAETLEGLRGVPLERLPGQLAREMAPAAGADDVLVLAFAV
ncbi:MAG TPA: fused response regulator/phosphatase [Fibrobacteria bacterium]|nr:fused response regulator/phosphatase [Fibrobacteria bacterium]HOX51214.1 fused response regulator/phosphatase [Fibrobacteria bacterium]